MSEAAGHQTLTLIAAADAVASGELQPGEPDEQGLVGWARKKVTTKRDVNLGDVKVELDRVEAQLETLLAGAKDTETAGFRLMEVEVGLSVTAEGSIGIATVGAGVSLTLRFSRSRMALATNEPHTT
jgi:hypothetical protein